MQNKLVIFRKISVMFTKDWKENTLAFNHPTGYFFIGKLLIILVFFRINFESQVLGVIYSKCCNGKCLSLTG